MKFMKTNEKELQTLFDMFDIKSAKCEYCDEMVTPQNCGGFCPRFEKNNDKPVILCKSILCMSSYLTYNEDNIKINELEEEKKCQTQKRLKSMLLAK